MTENSLLFYLLISCPTFLPHGGPKGLPSLSSLLGSQKNPVREAESQRGAVGRVADEEMGGPGLKSCLLPQKLAG